MKKNRTGLDLLLVLEAIVLIVLLVVGLIKPHTGYEEKRPEEGSTWDRSQEQTTQAALEENTAQSTTVMEMEVQKPLVFSAKVQKRLKTMTVKEKAAQLFLTTPEQLTGVDAVTIAGDSTKEALKTYPVGGLIYSDINLKEEQQIIDLVQGTQDYGKEQTGVKLFLALQEGGGETASPAASAAGYDLTASPADVAEDEEALEQNARTRGSYLKGLGFNMVLGPLADVADGSNTKHDALTYGKDTTLVAERIQKEITALQENNLISTVMSFPGESAVQTDYTACQAAIDAGVKCIMVSHLSLEDTKGEAKEPASLSLAATQMLRSDMGYDGLLVTGDLAEKTITNHYSIEEAAVKAVQSGETLLYVTKHFTEAYQAVLDAVKDGTISETVLDNAVGRILTEKLEK